MRELYVPIHLEALVAGNKELQVKDMEADFSKIGKMPFGSTIQIDTRKMALLGKGIHLHWTMPDVLLHGVSQNEEIEFPLLPNQWMILRLERKKNRIERKVWVLRSDVIHPYNPEEEWGSASITIPVYTEENGVIKPAGPNGKAYGFLGKCDSYDQYDPKEQAEQRMPLTAAGWGDVEFAAAYQKCASSFGFWDEIAEEEETEYTYLVCGYYTKEEEDPLYQMTEIEEKLGWYITDLEEGDFPNKTVCHGMSCHVKWYGKDKTPPSGVPEGEVEIAVGNNSAEAMSALMQNRVPQKQGMERLLNYQQQDILQLFLSEEEDAVLEAEEELHQRQFADMSTGYFYTLERASEKEEFHPLEIRQYRELEALNQWEREKQEQKQKRQFLEQQLYDCWCAYITIYNREKSEKNTGLMQQCVKRIKELLVQMDREMFLQKNMYFEKRASDLMREVEERQMHIRKGEKQRAYEPVSPVVLVHGAGVKRSFRQGYQNDGKEGLPCRIHTVSKRESIEKNEVYEVLGGKLERLPECCNLLMAEAVLLDDRLLETIIGKKVTEKVEEPPFDLAVSEWKQPWNPLELIWEVTINPLEMKDFILGEIDFERKSEVAASEKKYIYSGTTLLTPHAAANMAYQLKQLRGAGAELLWKAEKQDTLSQQLAGLSDECLMRKEIAHIPLYWEHWEEETGISLKEMQEHVKGALKEPLFSWEKEYFPIRAGIGKITRLAIVDSFGQMKEIQTWENEIRVHIAESMKLEEQKKFLLTPRFWEPCCLNAEWIAAKEGLRDVVDPYTTPICGFIRPDVINKTITIYRQNGEEIGIIESIKGGSQFRSLMEEVAGPEEIENAILREFAIVLATKKNALKELLTYISLCFEHILETENSNFYQLCFGKILALAQARVGINMSGSAGGYLKIDGETLSYQTDGYEETPFLVKFGDDRKSREGLIGFFRNGDMRSLSGTDLEAAKGIGGYVFPGNTWQHSLNAPEEVFTFLFDPLCSISIRTGFLPAAGMKLESCYYEDSVQKMEISFPVRPLIHPNGTVQIPMPDKEKGDWFWGENEIEKPTENLYSGSRMIAEGIVKISRKKEESE